MIQIPFIDNNKLKKHKKTNLKRISNYYLNDNDLLEKYVLYKYKDKIPSGDDIVDFFMNYEKGSSSYLKISFLAIGLLVLFF